MDLRELVTGVIGAGNPSPTEVIEDAVDSACSAITPYGVRIATALPMAVSRNEKEGVQCGGIWGALRRRAGGLILRGGIKQGRYLGKVPALSILPWRAATLDGRRGNVKSKIEFK